MARLNIVGGDYAGYECSKCSSDNTTFEEYAANGDNSELGIICDDCEHREEPDEFAQRFIPTEPEE